MVKHSLGSMRFMAYDFSPLRTRTKDCFTSGRSRARRGNAAVQKVNAPCQCHPKGVIVGSSAR